ncbi:hypothetical protein L6164_028572 [Bauhinia variegata]|uniref:Uncharacterized protein n=1 Tax=Bauhinia variegata TaxID=167791 RepID=A0ACB9L723_BAUVA|nr:hypothetical protein L6164_028572 [Bauhinia variegata]
MQMLRSKVASLNRLRAIGDLHGDLGMSKQAPRLANLIDASDKWIGGSTIVVQNFFDGFRARIAAFHPGGPISIWFLSQNVTVLVVGDSILVHGGLLPRHVSYGLEKINEEVRDWINGLSGRAIPCREEGVVWLRKFSKELAKNCDCSTLEHVLSTIPGVKRMIMGTQLKRLELMVFVMIKPFALI